MDERTLTSAINAFFKRRFSVREGGDQMSDPIHTDIYVPGAGITIKEGQYLVPPGPYEGVILLSIPNGLFNFCNPAICHVPGSGGNPYGHTMFMISPSIGYVQSVVPGTHRARFLPHDEFDRYMEETGKTHTWNMLHVDLPNPTGAANYITNCLLNGYTWVPWSNCLTMCHYIVQAAGGHAGLPSLVYPSTAAGQPGAIRQPRHKNPYEAIGESDL
jgi:hypothetical protein